MKISNQIKWLGLMLAGALLGLVGANAQPTGYRPPSIVSKSLLGDGIKSVWVTNTVSVTNLSVGTLPNKAGLIYTNTANTRFIVTASAYTNVNLLGSAKLPYPADGRSWAPPTNYLSTAAGLVSPAQVVIAYTSGSGANSAVTCVAHPKYKNGGIDTDTSWTFAFTPTANSSKIVTTNAPLWLWPGADELVLARIVNADTDANGQVVIRNISLDYPSSP